MTSSYLGVILFYILALVFLPVVYSAAYRTAFLASPADEDFFLALVVLCGCLLFVSSVYTFVCVLISCLFIFNLSLLYPFLATMPFAGYFPARFLQSAFPVFFILMFSRFDLVWFRPSCDHG